MGVAPCILWISEYLIWNIQISEVGMPLYIKDETTAQLVNQLAKLRGLTKQAAVRLAVATELQRAVDAVPLRKRFAELRKVHPLPPATGEAADKAFFDDLSGGL
jgi:antitoxin VapB